MVGDSGLNLGPGHDHSVGQLFDLAGQTQESALQSAGNSVISVRVSSGLDMNAALTTNGVITGGVTFFGHGGRISRSGIEYSALFVGQAAGDDTNLSQFNVGELSNVNLAPNVTITLNACNAGLGGRLRSL
jgi:hypothetical protein